MELIKLMPDSSRFKEDYGLLKYFLERRVDNRFYVLFLDEMKGCLETIRNVIELNEYGSDRLSKEAVFLLEEYADLVEKRIDFIEEMFFHNSNLNMNDLHASYLRENEIIMYFSNFVRIDALIIYNNLVDLIKKYVHILYPYNPEFQYFNNDYILIAMLRQIAF
ncbi:MAG: hypothetical protein ACTTGJ_03455 [Clostridium sp.]